MSETSLNMNYEPEVIVDTDILSCEDWLSYRKLGIGGSDVAAIMGISPFATIRKYGGYAEKELPEIEIPMHHSIDLQKYLTLSECRFIYGRKGKCAVSSLLKKS